MAVTTKILSDTKHTPKYYSLKMLTPLQQQRVDASDLSDHANAKLHII